MSEISDSISNFYSVKQFQSIFRIYIIILTPLLVITFFLAFINFNPEIFASGILEPYLSFLFIAITVSAIIFAPYFLYILFIERKKKWILSFFICVVIPFILAYMIFQPFFYNKMGTFFPVLFYGVYCLLLKSEVDRWLSRYYRHQAKQEAETEKDDEKIRIKSPF